MQRLFPSTQVVSRTKSSTPVIRSGGRKPESKGPGTDLTAKVTVDQQTGGLSINR